MANGGMQRGVYGRAESPYSADYLTAPFASGSSNGAGTATAASFAAFGLAEETGPAGGVPASNNGLCAYTPHRGGVISVRGNWPLTPTMDRGGALCPHHGRPLGSADLVWPTMPTPVGDLWRLQPWVPIPKASEVRPASYLELAAKADSLKGKRLGVPRMFIQQGLNWQAPATTPVIGGPDRPAAPHTRPSGDRAVGGKPVRRWKRAGAEVIRVDFPLVSICEGDDPARPLFFNRGIISPEFLHDDYGSSPAGRSNDFLRANGDPKLNKLAMWKARRSSPTIRAPCPIARAIWPPVWRSTSRWPSAALSALTR
jgi:amidase